MRIEPKHIMCALDFSDFSGLILSYGQALAREFGAKLSLCHVVSSMVLVSSAGQAYIASEKIEEERREDAMMRLRELARTLDMPCHRIVSTGHPADETARVAAEKKVDLVIAATHGGSGIKRFLIGSVTDRLVKVLECPLMVLHAGRPPLKGTGDSQALIRRILVGCDFSPDSGHAFEYALSLAQEFQSELYLAHVIRPEGEPAPDLEKKLTDLVPEDSRHWCTPFPLVLAGEPYREIVRSAEELEMDLIVLGIRGHSLLEQFLVGSTTDRVISMAGCPVLAVRQPQ